MNKSITDNEKLWSAFSYLWLAVFIPLLFKRDSEFVNFHARQGLVVFIGGLILMLLLPLVGWVISFLFSLRGLVAVWQDQEVELPGVKWVLEKIKN